MLGGNHNSIGTFEYGIYKWSIEWKNQFLTNNFPMPPNIESSTVT